MDFFRRNDFNSITNACPYVFLFQFRIVITYDLVKRESLAQQFENVLHGNSRSRNARLTEVYVGIYFYSLLHDSPPKVTFCNPHSTFQNSIPSPPPCPPLQSSSSPSYRRPGFSSFSWTLSWPPRSPAPTLSHPENRASSSRRRW